MENKEKNKQKRVSEIRSAGEKIWGSHLIGEGLTEQTRRGECENRELQEATGSEGRDSKRWSQTWPTY